ncbi:metallophosphoesterase [Saccharothrix australiensis]|uniref:Calcineurin-like phosphoesterase family protein n=1 Tax=Saccharothrix australiensis TaxID=2072 RepID=A0A495VSV6_9PSEU|nr:metallophosphoesterase [Saccharothrix australiensis]RKT52314.1 calcineurin-like phosphoesterase family protein [Saccharothrix australiensis]
MDRPLFVVGDVHGHLAELTAALHSRDLVDEHGDWSGGDAELWFLGDFVDRGPDGIGVIEFVMRLAEQADGQVDALVGNHEVLLLGMHRFGDEHVPDAPTPRSFARSWLLNGGLRSDQDRLTDRHIDWLTTRPVLRLVDDHLLMHSDTLAYLEWGSTIDEVNDAVREVLRGHDLAAWWECWRKMTTRYAFRGPDGGTVAAELLDALGGTEVVHGHSVIADQLGVPPQEIDGPLRYADGRVLAVDAGLYSGGPCLVVRLDEV